MQSQYKSTKVQNEGEKKANPTKMKAKKLGHLFLLCVNNFQNALKNSTTQVAFDLDLEVTKEEEKADFLETEIIFDPNNSAIILLAFGYTS